MSPKDDQTNNLTFLKPLFLLMLSYILTFHITTARFLWETIWSYYKLYKVLHRTLWHYINKSKIASLLEDLFMSWKSSFTGQGTGQKWMSWPTRNKTGRRLISSAFHSFTGDSCFLSLPNIPPPPNVGGCLCCLEGDNCRRYFVWQDEILDY